ncbi:hypothetical protein OESDEN_11168 [Oesophagostomum dentatum]|uniref:Uncharacterized protein n=1 Tax=Oesophagostomum dentatum TaxID=61180 RepID=A0A0B1SYN7_OESDE|nr:hypothetical protein OESDEN_11168 [Oesophagostomum dentatum]
MTRFVNKVWKIANVRGVWPQQKIIVYDLGLNASSAEDVKHPFLASTNDKLLKSKCFVELRPFPFDRYPLYVRNLKEYRWKPLIIAFLLQMVLKEFGAVWYMDASVRWMSDSRDVVYNEVTCRRNYWSRNLRLVTSEYVSGPLEKDRG